jgi:hypothetical protein
MRYIVLGRWVLVALVLAMALLVPGCVRYEDLAERSPVRLAAFEQEVEPGPVFRYAGQRSELLDAVTESKFLVGRWVAEVCRNEAGTVVVFLVTEAKTNPLRGLQSERETVRTIVAAWSTPAGVRVVAVPVAPRRLGVVEVGGSSAVFFDRETANRYVKVDFESQAISEFAGPSDRYAAAFILDKGAAVLEYVGVDGTRRVELSYRESEPGVRQMILDGLKASGTVALSRPGAPTGRWFWARSGQRLVGVNATNGVVATVSDVERVLFCSNRLLVVRNPSNGVVVYREDAESQWKEVGELERNVKDIGECSIDGRWLAVSYLNGLYQLVGSRWNWMLYFVDDDAGKPRLIGEYDTSFSSSHFPLWMGR